MAVNIDINLKTEQAQAVIESLRAHLETLEDEDLEIGIGFADDIDDISDSIQQFTNDVVDLRAEVDGLKADFTEVMDDFDGFEPEVEFSTPETGSDKGGVDPGTTRVTVDSEIGKAVDDVMGDTDGDISRAGLERLGMDTESMRVLDFAGSDVDELTEDYLNDVFRGTEPGRLADSLDVTDGGRFTGGGSSVPGPMRAEGAERQAFGRFGFGAESARQHIRRLTELTTSELEDVATQADLDSGISEERREQLRKRLLNIFGVDKDFLGDTVPEGEGGGIPTRLRPQDTGFGTEPATMAARRASELDVAPEELLDDPFASGPDKVWNLDRLERELGETFADGISSEQLFTGTSLSRDQLGEMDQLGAVNRRLSGIGIDADLTEDDLLNMGIDPEADFAFGGRGGRMQFNFLRPLLDKAELSSVKEALGGMKRRIADMIPSMQTWYGLIAALLPILIALGVQAAGAAVAMLTLAGAVGTIAALGLFGEGDDLGAAFENAQEKVSNLASEIFQNLQPTLQQFAPVTDDLFNFLPSQFTGGALEQLLAYEDDVNRMFAGIIGWFGDLATWAGVNQETISQLAFRFGELLGIEIIEFLNFLVQSASENQQMLVDLGGTFRDILRIILNLSMIFARAAEGVGVIFSILASFTGFLDNRFTAAIAAVIGFLAVFTVTVLTVVGPISMLVRSVYTLYGAMLLLSGGSIMAAITSTFSTLLVYVEAAILHLQALYGTAVATAAAIAATGIGALAVAGGLAAAGNAVDGMGGPPDQPGAGGFGNGGVPGASGTSARGGQTVINDNRDVNINVQGDLSRPAENRLRDTFNSMKAEDAAQDTP